MADSDARSGLALQAFLSPGYPVGSYAYSHGLEWAVESGAVTDRASLGAWIGDLLRHGSGWNDAVLLTQTVRVCRQDDRQDDRQARSVALRDLASLAAALAATGELRQESLQQGSAFLAVTRAAWPHPDLEASAEAIGAATAYPVCFGAAVAAHSCRLEAAVDGYLFALAANWISAAVRLNVIGQTQAQALAAEQAALAQAIGERARAGDLDDLGTCAFLADIAAFRHEQQHARLFRS